MAEEAEEHVDDVDELLGEGEDIHIGDPVVGSADAGNEDDAPDPIADLAKEMGWSPRDQWRGKPEDWKDPASFIRASRDINKRLSSDVRELRQTTERMGRVSASIVEREIGRAKTELEARYADAVENNDADAARKTLREIDRLDVEARSTRPPPEKPAVTAAFEERNAAWLGKNKGATALAVSECERLAQSGIMDPEAQLELAEREVKRRFPELFESERGEGRRDQPRLNGSQSRSSATVSTKKSAKDLPADARKAGEDFVKRGRVGSLQEYAEMYFEEQA